MDPVAVAPVDMIKEVLQGGPALIFAVMWWLERKERTALSKQLIDTLSNIGSMNEAWLKVLRGGSGDSGHRR